jgi:orotate phosphoribosyltransferase
MNTELTTEQKVAQALLKIGAVGFNLGKPITFKSGIVSPVYVDNRTLPFHPMEWKIVLEGFKSLVEKENIQLEIVAGVEAAGIPHSAALGYLLNIPSVFIRKQVKDHGTKKLVEGGDVSGKKVLLVEDLVSTGGSSLKAIEAMRAEGAHADDCLVIVSYDFAEAKENFKNANVTLHCLTSFPIILEEAEKLGVLNQDQIEKIKEWFADPHGWAEKFKII